MKKNENAFTGLEAAIVLIAFVVVAAVFSYVMLGAGFFTAQEAQTVVHTGMGQASSSIEVLGEVYGFNGTSTENSSIVNITYTIGLTSGNTPMDMARMRVTLATPDYREILTLQNDTGIGDPDRGNWSVTNIYDIVNEGDLVLDPNEKFQITVRTPTDKAIGADQRFTISMQPEVGAMTTVVRTTPADIKAVNILR
ncbi:MAG: Flagellin domain protein [Methanomicrobiales archaeon 53_19]|nr:MAG: Flagellin domain protein [Methanomicrobiales archaeon 53_19]